MVDVLTRPFVAQVAWFTLWQAVVSTVMTVGLAPVSYTHLTLPTICSV